MLENEIGLLTLDLRKRLTLDGVLNVESFSEEFLVLKTTLGSLEVEGADMKIEELSQNGGKILITGQINGLFYKDTKVSKGIFKKMFK